MKLGNLVEKAGLTKNNLKEAVKLGAGAAAFPFAYSLLQGALVKQWPTMFAQHTPGEYVTRALSGVMLGSVVANRLLKQPMVGDGIVASAVGSVFRDLLASYTSPAADAAQKTVTAAEMSSGTQQNTTTAPMGSGLAGLGLGRAPALAGYNGVSGLHGATLAIEESRPLAGATIAIEQPNFAAALM